MKFKNLNKKKLLIILLSSFVITNMSGCKKNDLDNIVNENNQINNSTEQSFEVKSSELTTTEAQTETIEKESITQYSNDDLVVISQLINLDKQTDTIETDENYLYKAKAIFITVVDFIFYDGEINGIKFNELTSDGKQKVLEIASDIDTKIENKFPNYKDTISSKTIDTFSKISELIKIGANNIDEFTYEKLGEENYNSLMEAKAELIDYTKEAGNIIFDFSSDVYEDSKEKIKNWYNNFKNN